MMRVLLVGCGGFLGAVARYGLAGWVHRASSVTAFPLGTMVVNVLGCFAIGGLGVLAETRVGFTGDLRLFLMIGLLGGFTTFSSFSYETHQLMRDGQMLWAGANILMQVALGLLGAWGGASLARMI